MKNFDKVLRDNIAAYEGRHDDLIYLALDLYCLLARLLDNARLPGRFHPLVSFASAYFILPADVISEEVHGPDGYVDDIFLCALVLDAVRRTTRDDAILINNWQGETAIMLLIEETRAKERDLIGDPRARILRYTGCDRVFDF